MPDKKQEILRADGICISFPTVKNAAAQHAVQDLDFALYEGELMAVVGASGSGKSLLAHGILGILPEEARMQGTFHYQGKALSERRLQELRGREISLVPQSVASLDPLMRVGAQVCKGKRDAETKRRCREVLARYGLGEEVERMYPHQLSGGMARRVLIATAVMHDPLLVIADEPTPGLHAGAARWVLQHFRELANDGAAVLLITHDLELAVEVADRVLVLYAGTAVEEAPAKDFLQAQTLRHPYSKALWHAMPAHDFQSFAGRQPTVVEKIGGCPFIARCNTVQAVCSGEIAWQRLGDGFVRCAVAKGEDQNCF